MKIAQIAPLMESVPPRGYGGTERVVSYLTEALVAAGHEVTLYASADSATTARLVASARRGLRLDPGRPDERLWTTLMLDRVFEDAPRYDVLHFHIDAVHFPLVRRCARRCVTTLHGRLDLPDLQPVYRHFAEQPVVSISDSQRAPLPWVNWRATVHHGLPRDLYRFHPRPDGYLAFIGRISPEKRVDRAIDIAIASGIPLRIAAKVSEVDQPYFDSLIRPRLEHPLVSFLGEIGESSKNDFVGQARAVLFPIDWPEPFGLVMIEAMAAGTPVIAYPCGSVPEVLRHGVTGFIVADEREAVAAVQSVDRIDRRRCRAEFEERFTADAMARRYLEVYAGLDDPRPPRGPAGTGG